ncbi:MAG: hypothetical protein DGJ47_000230 [Rickettsiaceae bacterium]
MNNKQHILIVDDDSRIVQLLKKFLIQNGYLVTASTKPCVVMGLLNQFAFDLIILDVMMPKISGTELTTEIKKIQQDVPIIMLTALSSTDNIIDGLSSGANDYIKKPFDPRELLLRIKNLLIIHKNNKVRKDVISFGINSYNNLTKTLTQNGKQVKLSNSDIKLLDILTKNINNPISREKIASYFSDLNLRSIDVQIVRLRNKIELNSKSPLHLKTIRNQGYALYS